MLLFQFNRQGCKIHVQFFQKITIILDAQLKMAWFIRQLMESQRYLSKEQFVRSSIADMGTEYFWEADMKSLWTLNIHF